jgi:hypothetical protein
MKKTLWFLLILALLAGSAHAEPWSFAAVGDNRSAFSSYRNVLNEIRSRTVNPQEKFPPFDFVLGCGDISPVAENHMIYQAVFPNAQPVFLPVRGNHEKAGDLNFILKELLPPLEPMLSRYDAASVSYYLDWKNVRLIVLDQYSSFGKGFNNAAARGWLEQVISSAKGARHIFIAFHEPYMPFIANNDPFWNLLLRHRAKVKAVFSGHTHVYEHQKFPDEHRGTDVVNVGNSGQTSHSDKRQTIVQGLVEDDRVLFRVLQAPDGTSEFKIREEWEVDGVGRDTGTARQELSSVSLDTGYEMRAVQYMRNTAH